MKRLYSALWAAVFTCCAVGRVMAGLPNRIANFTLNGTTHTALSISNAGVTNAPSGISLVHETLVNPPSISTIAYVNLAVSSTVLVAVGSTTVTSSTDSRLLAQPVFPSALTFTCMSASGDFNTSWVQGILSTATVVGIDSMGYYRQEQIICSTYATVTNYAYAFISSITLSNFHPAAISSNSGSIYINVGSTGTYGLANAISTSSTINNTVYVPEGSAMYPSSISVLMQPGTDPNFGLMPSLSGKIFTASTLSQSIAGLGSKSLGASTSSYRSELTPVMKVLENAIPISSATVNVQYSTIKPTTSPNGSRTFDFFYNAFKARRPVY